MRGGTALMPLQGSFVFLLSDVSGGQKMGTEQVGKKRAKPGP